MQREVGSDCCGERQGQEIAKLLSRQARNQRLREDRHTELVREVVPVCCKIGAVVQRKELIDLIRPAEPAATIGLTLHPGRAIMVPRYDHLSFYRHQC